MANGDGFIADYISVCLTEFNWSPEETMETPLPLIIAAIRGRRRRNNGWKGFGWIALDALKASRSPAVL